VPCARWHANTLRSMLTMLGIIIGVAAVITMIAVGRAPPSACRSR
jgi:ABC-type antimicrobial peptide transport system permease subunit